MNKNWARLPNGPIALDRGDPLAVGLVAWYPLTGWAGAANLARPLSGQTIVNGLTFCPATVEGAALFTAASDQYVNLGNPTALQLTGPMSIVCSYMLPTAMADLANYMLVAKDKDTGGRAYTLDIFRKNSFSSAIGTRFYINGGTGTDGTGLTDIATEGTAPASGVAKRVVAVYTGAASGGLRLTIDGVDKNASGATSTTIPSATANVLLGRREYTGFANPLNGYLWDVRIYNRALSAVEIQQSSRLDTRNRIVWTPGTRVYEFLGAAAGGGGGAVDPIFRGGAFPFSAGQRANLRRRRPVVVSTLERSEVAV